MKLSKLAGERFREKPADCIVDSHAFLIRGGYLKYVANGIFSSLLPLKRITQKIERILREEMDAIDGQEVQLPVVMPASLWQQSGRYESIGSELVRFQDRNSSSRSGHDTRGSSRLAGPGIRKQLCEISLYGVPDSD